MHRNPIIEELHRIRKDHARRFNYDIDAIFADLQRQQAKRKNLSRLKPWAVLCRPAAVQAARFSQGHGRTVSAPARSANRALR